MNVCEIVLNGWRSSEKIHRTRKCLQPHISQYSDSERLTKAVSKSMKHTIYTHFPKDRNCEVCLRTKMPRAPCRRRTGEALPRAGKFGDFVTADHQVLNEEGESRNNHRHAVVVQDLATQCVQSYPCKTNTSQETEKNSRKFPEPSVKTDHGIIELQHVIDSKRMALLKDPNEG